MSAGTIFPDEKNDHGYHLASRLPRSDCAECDRLPRWPIKKVGYLTRNQFGQWVGHGWDFDTAAPDTYPWTYNDLIRFAQQEQQLAAIETVDHPQGDHLQ